MKGNINSSIKLAKELYNYKSPEEPGNLPKGIIIKNIKYLLIPITHTAVCDSKGCQNQYNNIDKNDLKKLEAYAKAPIYSNWGNSEICLVCADLKNIDHFVPTQNDTNYMMEILDTDNMSCCSDEGDYESDYEGDYEGDYDSENDSDNLNNKMGDLTMSFIR